MARRDHHKDRRSEETTDFSTDSEVLRQFIKKTSVVARPLHLSPPKPLTLLEDRRTFHPDKLTRPAAAIPKKASRLRAGSAKQSRPHGPISPRIGFTAPKQVAVCVRRHTRRSVLFAKNLTRKGAGSGRRRRNEWSNVTC